MEFIKSEIFLIAVTFAVFWGAKRLQALTGWVMLNPVLVTVLIIIGLLKLAGLSYDDYRPSGAYIEFWLKPAIVALAVPLYTQLESIRRQFVPILLSQLAGCITGIVSVALIASALGASREVVISLVPKSVTIPIAIEITRQIGGIPSLTAAIVVSVGLLGAVAGLRMLQLGHISSPMATGLSMGTASHVIGTTRVSELGDRYGAFATVGLIINGVLTALLAGPLVAILPI